MPLKLQSGKAYPLGAVYDGKGVNFALFSANAEKVALCLFDHEGVEETHRIEIRENDHGIWHVYVEGLKPGQVYGYRVDGPYKPLEGKRFNFNKLLIDPYARKLTGKLIWDKAIFGYDVDSPEQDLSFSTSDSAPYVPKSVVTANDFDWEGDQRPGYHFKESIIYELHTKGYTMLHPLVDDSCRGKFLGLASKSVVNYLKWLKVTAVELLPSHAYFLNKPGNNRTNYWGYESLCFFAPESAYLINGEIDEFKAMVKELHRHKLEVIMDVVYNHTGEGNQLGPTLCYRGIDNESYYTLDANNRRYYYDSTGCGASFNLQNPNVLTLVMDSLRYWAEEMHVDGFRLDLASSLSRLSNEFTQNSGFLLSARQDAVLRQVKMIAEPWDVDMGGYQLGAFPPGWGEWNDRYRDVVRRFWRGDDYQTGEFASRIAGSSDIFGYNNRNLWSSVNFITAHDGFNLQDLVSFNQKHNEANGEENRDGSDANWSWNSGIEGYTEDLKVNENRRRRARALMATLLLSFGTPMISAGDEFGNTQFGNNNPYCQDNLISWIAWEAITMHDRKFARFVQRLIKLRRCLDIFKTETFFRGQPGTKKGFKDLAWYTENGTEFTDADWNTEHRKAVAYLASGCGKLLLAIFNAGSDDKDWKLPPIKKAKNWTLLLDSSNRLKDPKLGVDLTIKIPAWSVVAIEIEI